MKKKGFTLVELLVVIAIIALLMGILMPALARVRQIAFRMVCGTNLSGIGKAMLIYANDYDDEMPRSGGPAAKWGPKIVYDAENILLAYAIPTTGTGGTGNVTSSFFLLVKYAEVTTKSFVCKGDSGVTEWEPPVKTRDVITYWDFGDAPASKCSYSLHQPFCIDGAGYPLTTSSDPGMAVAADPNPWLDKDALDARPNASKDFAPNGGKDARNLGNSITHQDEGQNVLFLDSHVNFENTSACGINDDNIFTQATATDIQRGTIPTSGGLIPISRQDNLIVNDYGSGASKGRACFVGETLVCVNDTLVPMSQVEAGQELANAASIEELETHTGTFECHDVTLENGNVISVVGSHLFKLDSGLWVHAQDLRSGLNLATQNGTIAIENVSTRNYVGTVYNVKVSQSEEYMVGQDYVVVRDW